MNTETIENFFGVYLLYCLNPRYKGRTYIGYTVDPNRRLKQHNKGKQFGGAWKTSNRGPWSMVMIIHGFPNDISALRFEWAWQHPHVSRRLKHVGKKKRNEKTFNFCLRVLSEMLKIGPWCRLPLTIRWLNSTFATDFAVPPLHMPICHGSVISKKIEKSSTTQNSSNSSYKICDICSLTITGQILKCVNYNCDLNSHVTCLSKKFLKLGEYVPVEGKCPKCEKIFLWGDLVRKFKGCYNNMDLEVTIEDAAEFYMSDSD
ncbi:structure-specific endonuclease subunit slx1 [Diabrotica undecimpunctata]|uniref:structure-specific endonuclease subunit slx1 n=1 Tax=Diabrotica undecimpunctata TaxID=50387 RepID=UPI003B636EF8